MTRAIPLAMVLMLILMPLQIQAAEPKATVSCVQDDISAGQSVWSLSDQSCLRMSLGLLSPGTTVEFNISTNAPVDILLFSSTGVVVYQQEQNYRRADVWESSSVFEDFSGDGDWKWSTPLDRGSTRWYLVIDNLDHAQDQDEGALGGSTVGVSLGAAIVTAEPFTLFSRITHLQPSSFATLVGPFNADSGTVVKITASSMEGESDVFLMTQNQYQLYSAGAAPARIEQGSLLLISSSQTVLYSIEAELDGSELYVVLDNKGGGGGVGLSNIATTVTVSLTPILDPRIKNSDDLSMIDVGSTVVLDASETPNRSGQIASEGYLWDVNGDGFSDLAGISVETTWDEPGDLTIYLRVIGVDGRPATKFQEISVSDLSPPLARIEGSENITRAFSESISMTGTYSDNWQVVSVKWYLGDSLILTDPSPLKEGVSSLNLEVRPEEVNVGTHILRMEVTDASGMVSNSTANLTVYDATPPSVNNPIVELTKSTGESITLVASAIDPESVSLGYSWDIDVNVDSDGDGITNNDPDLSGPTFTSSFSKVGIYSLICTVTNDNGLETKIEYIIAVEQSDTDLTLIDQIGPYLPLIVSALSVVILSLVVVLVILRRAKRKKSQVEEEMNAQEMSQMQQPTESEQKEMFSRTRYSQDSGFGFRRRTTTPVSNDPDVAVLLGREPGVHPQEEKTDLGDSLLSMMNDEEDAVPSDEVRKSATPGQLAAPTVPDLTALDLDSEPQDDTGEGEAVTETDPPPIIEDGNQNPEVSDSEPLVMTIECNDCSAQIKLKLPPGAPGARVPCPKCGSIQVARRP